MMNFCDIKRNQKVNIFWSVAGVMLLCLYFVTQVLLNEEGTGSSAWEQFFFSMPRWGLALLNSILILGTAVLMNFLLNKPSLRNITFLLAGMIAFCGDWKSALLPGTRGVGKLIPYFLPIVVLFFFCMTEKLNKTVLKWIAVIIMFVGETVISYLCPQMGVAAFFAFIILCITDFKRKKCSVLTMTTLTGCIIGILLWFVFQDGYGVIKEAYAAMNCSAVDCFINQSYWFARVLFQYGLPLLSTLICILFVSCIVLKQKLSRTEMILLLFFLGAWFSLGLFMKNTSGDFFILGVIGTTLLTSIFSKQEEQTSTKSIWAYLLWAFLILTDFYFFVGQLFYTFCLIG